MPSRPIHGPLAALLLLRALPFFASRGPSRWYRRQPVQQPAAPVAAEALAYKQPSINAVSAVLVYWPFVWQMASLSCLAMVFGIGTAWLLLALLHSLSPRKTLANPITHTYPTSENAYDVPPLVSDHMSRCPQAAVAAAAVAAGSSRIPPSYGPSWSPAAADGAAIVESPVTHERPNHSSAPPLAVSLPSAGIDALPIARSTTPTLRPLYRVLMVACGLWLFSTLQLHQRGVAFSSGAAVRHLPAASELAARASTTTPLSSRWESPSEEHSLRNVHGAHDWGFSWFIDTVASRMARLRGDTSSKPPFNAPSSSSPVLPVERDGASRGQLPPSLATSTTLRVEPWPRARAAEAIRTDRAVFALASLQLLGALTGVAVHYALCLRAVAHEYTRNHFGDRGRTMYKTLSGLRAFFDAYAKASWVVQLASVGAWWAAVALSAGAIPTLVAGVW